MVAATAQVVFGLVQLKIKLIEKSFCSVYFWSLKFTMITWFIAWVNRLWYDSQFVCLNINLDKYGKLAEFD